MICRDLLNDYPDLLRKVKEWDVGFSEAIKRLDNGKLTRFCHEEVKLKGNADDE